MHRRAVMVNLTLCMSAVSADEITSITPSPKTFQQHNYLMFVILASSSVAEINTQDNKWTSTVIQCKFVYITIELFDDCYYSFIISLRDKYSRQRLVFFCYST